MGVGALLYMYDVVVSSRSLSHLLMSSCNYWHLYYVSYVSICFIIVPVQYLAAKCQ